MCLASQGSVRFQVSLGEVPAKSCWPMPPPLSLLLLAAPAGFRVDPVWTADVTGKLEAMFCDLSSCSRLPGTGASSVRQTNLIRDSRLIRASMSSLFFWSVCPYSCQPNTWSGCASATICSGVMDALLDINCIAPNFEQAWAIPASPEGWAKRAIAAGDT